MTPDARIALLIDVLDEALEGNAPADVVMANFTRVRRFVGAKDRKALAEHFYDIYRHFARLRHWLGVHEQKLSGRTLVIGYLAKVKGYTAQTMAGSFTGGKFGADCLDDREIALCAKPFATDAMPDHVRLECPSWAFDTLKNTYGEALATELQALNQPAPLDLRVNILKAERASVLKYLQDDGLKAEITPWSPFGIRVEGRPAFSAHPLYRHGHFDVQDEGSQILALLSGAHKGQTVVDFCAGAGGKTLAIGMLMANKGRIYACDTDERRLSNGRQRYARAGLDTVELRPLRHESDPWVQKHAGIADIVLVDAPCSGMGTWRRSPFARWQSLNFDLDRLVPLQQAILTSASALVKMGGSLFYATCSMAHSENQAQIDQFLANHREFVAAPLAELWRAEWPKPAWLDDRASSLQMTPARHGTDGFFIGRLKKIH